MKIGIDISLAVGEKAGVGHYSWELVKGLAEIDRQNEYILYPLFYNIRDPLFKTLPPFQAPNFRYNHCEHSAREAMDLWESPSISKKDLLGPTDVLHTTTVCCPRDHYGKVVFTAYDVSFLTHPQFHTEANRLICLRGSLDAVLWADKIIAISRHTKEDMVKYFNVPEDRLVVVHLAHREEFRPIDDTSVLQKVRIKYNLKKDYILMVGSIEPRKNHQLLIRAYNALPGLIRKKFDLILGGGSGWLNTDIFELVKNLRIQDQVRFLGYIPDADLPAIINAATVFAYPSFYEGFGLPVLEAMACGTPVITSNVSSLPEIVENAGIMIDPSSMDELRERLIEVLKNDSLRENLRRKGLEQAKKFSWRDTAKRTLEIYEQLVAN
jgi:glycosyltransferase involved in cell wall biosynthesis